MAIFHKSVLFSLLLFLTGNDLSAGVLEQIAQDFGPVSGYVVMVEPGEIIIDQGANSGVQIGDLFAVVAPGKKIVHPVSGKVLGMLEDTKAVLRVVRLKPDFSHARIIKGKGTVKEADVIRRYENMTVMLWDYTEQGESLYAGLQKTLPELKWIPYSEALRVRPQHPSLQPQVDADMIFINTPEGLEVKDSHYVGIRHYGQLPMGEPQAEIPAEASRPSQVGETSGSAAPVILPPAPVTPKFPEPEPSPVTEKSTAAVQPQFKPLFKEMPASAEIEGSPVTMADFINLPERTLMVVTDGVTIEIYQLVGNQVEKLPSGKMPYPAHILSVQWWQPESGGSLYVVAVSWFDNNVSSEILKYTGNSLEPSFRKSSWIYGVFDMDNDSRPESLFVQEFSREVFFGPRVQSVRIEGDDLVFEKSGIEFPKNFSILGSRLVDLTGDGRLETVFVRKGNLYVYSGKERLYKSPKQMGGSLSMLTYDYDPKAKNLRTITVSIEVPPVVANLDNDGASELLAVNSEQSAMGLTGAGPGVKKSWLTALKFMERQFVEGEFGESFNDPVQGLGYSGSTIFVLTAEPESLFQRAVKNRLHAFPVAR